MRIFRILAGTTLAGLLSVGGVTAASAYTCPTGYVCVFQHDSYAGHYLVDGGTIRWYNSVSWDDVSGNPNDEASSFQSRFTRCYVRVYKDYNLTGSSMRFSYPAIGGQYQDPNLTNGGPGTEGTNWDNKISSHGAVDCS